MAAAVVPEQGQLVQVRNRNYIVQDVWAGTVDPEKVSQHRVRLEALDDDQVGEELDVIWEHEVNTRVLDPWSIPEPDRWDPIGRFDAFLLSARWSRSSVVDRLPLQAPFRGGIQIEEYQLEPVVRALRMPRVNLLIADDVGLGKTIEAGMVVQEMLARQRIRKILIVCPASLQRQWADEMLFKFSLRFEVVDRAYVQQLRKEYGVHVNAWASYPRLITSMDFIKREEPLRNFRASLERDRRGGLPAWDLLIVDEVHNVSPAGRTLYVRDSDRTEMMREILPDFEHRLFLTATPHNGFTQSFTAMLEMLDPLRFSRGAELDKKQLDTVMIRRMKDDMVDAVGRRLFPKRTVDALDSVKLSKPEREMLDTLDDYIESRTGRASEADRLPVQFALTLLKKRLLSSPLAFRESIQVHQSHLASEEAPRPDQVSVVASLKDRLSEDFSDDEEKDRTEETAQAESSCFFDATDQERRMVERLRVLATTAAEKPDSKFRVLEAWIESHLFTKGKWNDERLIIFTEYKDTLEYLKRELERKGYADRVLTLFGGMPEKDSKDGSRKGREGIKAAFRAPPEEEPVRILVATDTASEGLNLQDHCRYLIHWEIPWNPNRMEQRNGRIDRHGQEADEVFCWHFVYEGWEDQRFLDVVVDKVRTQRADIGAVGDVIAAQVEQALRKERTDIKPPEDRRKVVRDEVKADLVTKEQMVALREQLREARESWQIFPDTVRLVLEEALQLIGHQGLEPVTSGELAERGFLLHKLPPQWSECRPFIQDSKGRLFKLVFEDELARGRPDVTLVHLEHPLMKRAMAVFRANLWSVGVHESHQLSRASYRVVPRSRLGAPVVILVSRLVCISAQSQKLHEELLLTGGEFTQHTIARERPEPLAKLLGLPGQHPAMPKGLAVELRKHFPSHRRRLLEGLEAQAREREKELREALKERGTEEAKGVRQLIDERQKEIAKRIAFMENDLGPRQLRLFDEQEKDQYRRDVAWLKSRQAQLALDRVAKPEAVKARYLMRGKARRFPLALLYLLPDELLKGWR
ncbi:MAG: DISARM system SNF2-like helicase DrmD [Acidobacteriota bacterium]